MTKDAALEVALKALEKIAFAGMAAPPEMSEEGRTKWHAQEAFNFIGIAAWTVDSVKEILAQTSDSVKQEPVGTFFVQHWRGLENQHFDADGHGLPDGEYKLYTTPPKRQPLTDEQIADYLGDTYLYMTQYDLRFFKLGEKAAHGIKETT